MSDTEPAPTAPVTVAEPDDSDPPGDVVELVGSGWTRLVIDGHRFRLRRPFLGELRNLRTLAEDNADQVRSCSDDAQALGRRLIAEVEALEMDETADEDSKAAARSRAREQSAVAGRKLTNLGEDRRVEWWTKAFELLAVDGTPSDWPGWIVDPTLPDRVLAHWRSVPLGRG